MQNSPPDWKTANITPVFQNGKKVDSGKKQVFCLLVLKTS